MLEAENWKIALDRYDGHPKTLSPGEMMNQYELEGLWVEGALPDVIYKFGDEVRMKGGERAGEVGRIVALFSRNPAPHYVIEFRDGVSENALQFELERAG